MQTHLIRKAFLDYFSTKSHQIVASSPLVPLHDQSLLFTNAGMVQFKQVFLGKEVLESTRVASSQLCIRAGGKHNDLENVGYTARHHTLFEMLGNFSFGDYFKHEAIQFAWEFLTEILNIPAEKLWVTVFSEDQEAEKIWLEDMKVNSKRFSRLGEKDNFWSMGDTGPCGPCSEIFYDHGPEVAGGPPGSADEDGDRYVEIWNLVFMQFDRAKDGSLTPLPKPSVDTGMGLERIAAVMQGVTNNYDIDLFATLLDEIMRITNTTDRTNPSLRVIADHIRSCVFLIAEGVLPANEGRSYVLRRIIRRAIRHGHKLGVKEAFFHRLVPALVMQMGKAYPKLVEKQSIIENILLKEEQQFARTLDHGMELLEKSISALGSNQVIPGEIIFRLYDTFGFPVDLTADIARERNLALDMAGFDQAMEQQKAQARSASQFGSEEVEQNIAYQTEFVGYEKTRVSTNVIALIKATNETDSLNEGEEGIVVLEKTPFYPEGGGQIGDSGVINWDDGEFLVRNTKKSGDCILHYGKALNAGLTLKTSVSAIVNESSRCQIAANHSATHLMHAALREILGEHVQQKGSLVEGGRLRFDFSHHQPVNMEELVSIESRVNQQIRNNTDVSQAVMSFEEAKQQGAMALFGEKYSDQVRVLSMGSNNFSMELCGGTHVNRTGDIGFFHIVSEAAVASGVRRIEAITGICASDYVKEQEQVITELESILKANRTQLSEKTQQLLAQNKELQKTIDALQETNLRQQENDLLNSAQVIEGIHVLVACLDGVDVKKMRDMVDRLKNKHEKSVVVLASVVDQKVALSVGVSKNITSYVHAGELVNMLAKQLGGKGGGRPDMAQAGAAYVDNLSEILETTFDWIRQKNQGS